MDRLRLRMRRKTSSFPIDSNEARVMLYEHALKIEHKHAQIHQRSNTAEQQCSDPCQASYDSDVRRLLKGHSPHIVVEPGIEVVNFGSAILAAQQQQVNQHSLQHQQQIGRCSGADDLWTPPHKISFCSTSASSSFVDTAKTTGNPSVSIHVPECKHRKMIQLRLLLAILADEHPQFTVAPHITVIAQRLLDFMLPGHAYCIISAIMRLSYNDDLSLPRWIPINFDSFVVAVAQLVNKRFVKTAAFLERFGVDIVSICHAYISTLFSSPSVIVDTQRVVDMYILDGSKAIVRLILAMIQMRKAAIKSSKSTQQITSLLLAPPPLNSLLSAAYSLRLSRTEYPLSASTVSSMHAGIQQLLLPRYVQSSIDDALFVRLWQQLSLPSSRNEPKLLYNSLKHGLSFKNTFLNCILQMPILCIVGLLNGNIIALYVNSTVQVTNAMSYLPIDPSAMICTLTPTFACWRHLTKRLQSNIAAEQQDCDVGIVILQEGEVFALTDGASSPFSIRGMRHFRSSPSILFASPSLIATTDEVDISFIELWTFE